MNTLVVYVEGIGAWLPGLTTWPALRGWLCDECEPATDAPARPAATILPAGERRRAPLAVLMAVEAATQAVAMSGRDAARLPSVFASANGDTSIVDAMCATLAHAPRELSPTQFHNSVHNAAAGYWTIASGCREASSAITAGAFSFAAGLLEASVQALAGDTPVLLVASDDAGHGPLAEAIPSTRPFAAALVLSPKPSPHAIARLRIQPAPATGDDPPRHSGGVALASANLSARGLALLEALARAEPRRLRLDAAPALGLIVELEGIAWPQRIETPTSPHPGAS